MKKDKIEYAIYYATKAHKGQRRKVEDIDMIFHPFTCGMLLQRNGCDENVVCAGILHDVVEDTEVTFEELSEFGYPTEVIDILKLLTKQKGADYQAYIDNIIASDNVHAMNIKMSDLKHNMDITRISNPTVNDYERVNKRYAPAYEKIQNRLNELEENKNVRY